MAGRRAKERAMRLKAMLWGTCLVAAATLGLAAPASAQVVPSCVGTTGTAYVCSDPTGRTLISDCVYLGDPTCTPVVVPGPTLTCGGALVDALGMRCPRI